MNVELKRLFEIAGIDTTKGKASELIESDVVNKTTINNIMKAIRYDFYKSFDTTTAVANSKDIEAAAAKVDSWASNVLDSSKIKRMLEKLPHDNVESYMGVIKARLDKFKEDEKNEIKVGWFVDFHK